MDQVKFVKGSLFEVIWSAEADHTYHFKFFKGCLPQISLVNTLLQVRDEAETKVNEFCERWCKTYNRQQTS